MFKPMLSGPIPHFVWPDKPMNGGGIYMQHFDPASLRAGYMFAINCFSDAYINFGLPGIVVMALLLGWIYAGVDRRRASNRSTFFDYILMFNLYILMREPLAPTFDFMIYQFLLYIVIKAILTVGERKRVTGRTRDPMLRPNPRAGAGAAA